MKYLQLLLGKQQSNPQQTDKTINSFKSGHIKLGWTLCHDEHDAPICMTLLPCSQGCPAQEPNSLDYNSVHV